MLQALVACRAEKGLSLQEAADEMGLSKGGLSQIERGLTQLRRTTRYRLVAFLRKYGYAIGDEEAA